MMNKDGRWMVWPEQRFVSCEKILSWATDVVSSNTGGNVFELDLEEAISILERTRVATFATAGVTPTESAESTLMKRCIFCDLTTPDNARDRRDCLDETRWRAYDEALDYGCDDE
mgnify:CR=1 FL=1